MREIGCLTIIILLLIATGTTYTCTMGDTTINVNPKKMEK